MSAEALERRIPVGPLAGLPGAALLLVSLFLDWWEGTAAFTAFEVLDLVLVALALGAVFVHARALGAPLPGAELPTGLVGALGVVAFVLVMSQVVNEPPAIVASGRGAATGIWLGLAGSVLMLVGGTLVAARIAVALDADPERVSKRPRGPVAVKPPEPAAAKMRRRAAAGARAAAAAKGDPEPDRPAAPASDDGPEP